MSKLSLAPFWESLTQEERTTIYMLCNRANRSKHLDYAQLPFAALDEIFEALGAGNPYDFLTIEERRAFQNAERVMDQAMDYLREIYRNKGLQHQRELINKLGWNDRSIPTRTIFGD